MEEDPELKKIREKKLKELMEQQSKPQFPTGIIHMNSARFTEIIKTSKLPVIVDYSAQWCGPCRIIAPIFERLANDFAGKIIFGKIDVDEEPGIARAFGINAVPTLIIFKEGKPVERLLGVVGYDQLYKLLDQIKV
ncbi:MAG: thioredoxin [Candidatus Jordarchaeum sp.]|uniref:thioredoxin n=1 Tax=Candidatus Jordarchaeum sp. TaxID=2823881 RepID=UPI00404AD936